jgi:hypothetical protein
MKVVTITTLSASFMMVTNLNETVLETLVRNASTARTTRWEVVPTKVAQSSIPCATVIPTKGAINATYARTRRMAPTLISDARLTNLSGKLTQLEKAAVLFVYRNSHSPLCHAT